VAPFDLTAIMPSPPPQIFFQERGDDVWAANPAISTSDRRAMLSAASVFWREQLTPEQRAAYRERAAAEKAAAVEQIAEVEHCCRTRGVPFCLYRWPEDGRLQPLAACPGCRTPPLPYATCAGGGGQPQVQGIPRQAAGKAAWSTPGTSMGTSLALAVAWRFIHLAVAHRGCSMP
jgi:hypothetical protein